MPAPTNNPVISSIPLAGPSFLLGEVTNQYQPTKIGSWNVVIPTVLLGNEAVAGYAAFTSDGVTATRGVSGYSTANFLGFFANYNFWEGDVGTNPYTETLGGQFQAPVCNIGSIYVYNSTAISSAVGAGLNVVLAVSSGVTPAAILVGSVVQGSPLSSTVLNVSSLVRARSAQTVVGAGVLVDLVQS